MDPKVFFATLLDDFFEEKGKAGTDRNYVLKYKRWKLFNTLRGRSDCLLNRMMNEEKTNEWILLVIYLV